MDRRTFLLTAAGGALLTDLAASNATADGTIPSSLQRLSNSGDPVRPGIPIPKARAAASGIVTLPFDAAALTADVLQYAGGRYERYKRVLVFTADAIALNFQVTNFASGGATNLAFVYPRYALRVRCVLSDGALAGSSERARYARLGTERLGTLIGALGDESDGPCLLEIIGIDATGNSTSLMTHGAYIDRRGAAKNHPMTIMQTCSRDWETLGTMKPPWPIAFQYAIVPKTVANTTRVKPLPPRLGAPLNSAVAAAMIARIEYVVGSNGVGCTPCVTKSGIVTTEARQNYAYSDVIAKAPRLPLLDGDRGVCTTPYTTDLVWGRKGQLYGANSWQAWVVDATGHKRTLYGIRHRYPPIWTEAALDGPEVEVVGDWDGSIPLTERHAWESWGMAWDTRSIAAIDDAAPIPPGETEHPHVGAGPVHFRTDRHGYVLRVQFDGHSHATPAKVRRWAQCDDPWSIFYLNGRIFVTERGKNRISIWSADNPGQYLGNLIADPAASSLGAIEQQQRRWHGASYTDCRLRSIVAPEGMALLDGYVYWGSYAQREVRRMPAAGGPVEICCRPQIDGNSNYVYVAISDGSFGPRGTLFITTWSIYHNGRPQAFLPVAGMDKDGTPCTHTSFQALKSGATAVNAALWQWQHFIPYVPYGPGGSWATDGYASAVAVGRLSVTGRPEDPAFGALACSSSAGNLSVYMQADPRLDGPAVDYSKARRGGQYYQARHQVLNGPWCAGPDVALPWGEDPDCDYFMAAVCGYSRT